MDRTVSMEAQDEEMLGADIEDLEIFAGWLFVYNLDAGCSIFLEVDNRKEALVEGHLRREVLLHSADEEELFSLWNFNHVDMTDNEEIIEDVFISFDAF